MGDSLYDSVWIHGYKLGWVYSELKMTMKIGGEAEVRKLCPDATDEMLEDLQNAGKGVDNKTFTKKYERILVEMDLYKALEEEARQVLKEQEERESARRFMNEAVEFLTSADKITKKALKRKVPIALYSSISRNYILPGGFKQEELESTEARMRLAKYFLYLYPLCQSAFRRAISIFVFFERIRRMFSLRSTLTLLFIFRPFPPNQ